MEVLRSCHWKDKREVRRVERTSVPRRPRTRLNWTEKTYVATWRPLKLRIGWEMVPRCSWVYVTLCPSAAALEPGDNGSPHNGYRPASYSPGQAASQRSVDLTWPWVEIAVLSREIYPGEAYEGLSSSKQRKEWEKHTLSRYRIILQQHPQTPEGEFFLRTKKEEGRQSEILWFKPR